MKQGESNRKRRPGL